MEIKCKQKPGQNNWDVMGPNINIAIQITDIVCPQSLHIDLSPRMLHWFLQLMVTCNDPTFLRIWLPVTQWKISRKNINIYCFCILSCLLRHDKQWFMSIGCNKLRQIKNESGLFVSIWFISSLQQTEQDLKCWNRTSPTTASLTEEIYTDTH